MGGRGASFGGGQAKGLRITDANGTVMEYREINGKIYNTSGIIPREINTTLSLKDIAKNAQKNGSAKVSLLNSKDIKNLDDERKKKRKETDKFLNEMWYRAAPKPRKGWKGH